ncbi:alpha/beta fold hydrolase [Microscilla marina]|uniref:Alpha/beta hydrolase fold n=1 Tax=Microscilla marina ATCC 23134 TaxID=313606 RepID=A1ZQV3_MICM2|nr:alpha/beta hydrolase [Microscilla marina]EAY27258.1 alpha/beta hydrolase fold [Microscilla marina ATCC 23134]
MNNPALIQFTIDHEITIAAEAWGNPQAKPVILLHGGGQTRHSWGETAQLLAEQGWYAVAYDARGHGKSSWAAKEENYDLELMVQDLKMIAAQLKGKPILVGASMGGLTAMLAQGESEEVFTSAVILVDVAPRIEQKGVERIFKFMSANMEQGFANLDEAADAVAAYMPHRPRPKTLSRLEKNLRKKEDGRYYWHWDPKIMRHWMRTNPDKVLKDTQRMYAAANQLSVPTLIVRGGMSDVVSEQVMAEFLDKVPHAQSVDVSGAGHMVAGDSNHAFSKAVIQFLNDVYSV